MQQQGQLRYPLEIYQERLAREIAIIKQMQFPGYFMIVWDFIRYARQNQIPVGPGRGSAAGSLVSYCLRITDIDPIQYGLLFERFLNPERISMPDIDIDFCTNRRGQVINYVTQKYGRENVSQIITFGTMAAKAAVKDAGPGDGYTLRRSRSHRQAYPRHFEHRIEDGAEGIGSLAGHDCQGPACEGSV
jgi:DNA polymerase-3 subunit alpha